MSQPYDPNDDFDLDGLNLDDFRFDASGHIQPSGDGMDDFDIRSFTSQVDFSGADEPSTQEPTASAGDTGEYIPVQQSQVQHRERRHTAQGKKKKKKGAKSVRALRRLLITLIYLLVVICSGYLIATFGWNWANDLLALNKDELTASVTLDADMFTVEQVVSDSGTTSTVYYADLDQVSEVLEENGLIEYPWLFRLFTTFTKKNTRMAPGTYELNTNMDYSALLRNMGATSSARTTVSVMIPEGYTVEEIIQLLADQGVATVDELTEAAANYEFNYDFLDSSRLGDATRLEGYLFPDTYEFYKNGDAATALNRMLANFDSKIDDDMRQRATDLGYSLADIITIASIVEKETDGVDQNNISSVIYNRLTHLSSGTNGYLQMDSTIQYILEERKEKLTSEDLAIDSPYNTYLYAGLPAGPICCPGLDSIEAALYPADTSYFYFILGDDGSTHFFADYNDFLTFRDAQTGVIQDNDDGGNLVEG
jgi:UPF0755 protein